MDLVWKLISGVVVLLRLLTGWLALRSDVDVQPSFLLNNSDPFSVQFSVSNQSPFAIHDVDSQCLVDFAHSIRNDVLRRNLIRANPIIMVLDPKEKNDVNCGTFLRGGSYDRALMRIYAEWRPGWWPFRKHKSTCFKGALKSDGHMVWSYAACAESDGG